MTQALLSSTPSDKAEQIDHRDRNVPPDLPVRPRLIPVEDISGAFVRSAPDANALPTASG